ncbi:MAG: hypothetical protein ACYDA4_07405 [Ignavibacteriaceae bacterium]
MKHSGKPAWFYTYPLFEYHNQIVVDNNDPKIKTFYCFDWGKKMIEVLRIDFQNNIVQRNTLYSLGPITDLKIIRNNGDFASIYVAFINNGSLGLSIIEYHNYRYTYNNYQNLAYYVRSANISLAKDISLVYLQVKDDIISLNKAIFKSENISTQNKISIRVSNLLSTAMLTSDFLNRDKDETVCLITADSNSSIIFSTNRFTNIVKTKKLNEDFSANKTSDFYFGEIRSKGLKKLFYYSPINNSINMVEFIRGGKEIAVSKIADADNLQSYFIKNMSYRKTQVVFTDKKNNCITIKQLL